MANKLSAVSPRGHTSSTSLSSPRKANVTEQKTADAGQRTFSNLPLSRRPPTKVENRPRSHSQQRRLRIPQTNNTLPKPPQTAPQKPPEKPKTRSKTPKGKGVPRATSPSGRSILRKNQPTDPHPLRFGQLFQILQSVPGMKPPPPEEMKYVGRTLSASQLGDTTPSPHAQIRSFSFREYAEGGPLSELNPAYVEVFLGAFEAAEAAGAGLSKDRYIFLVKDEIKEHRHTRLTFEFFRIFAEIEGIELPEDLTESEIDKIVNQANFNFQAIYEFYIDILRRCLIDDPGIFELFYIPGRLKIRDLELAAEAAYNVMALITRIYKSFHEEFPLPGSSTNIFQYFFHFINHKEWRNAIEELNLKGLALTWIPKLFCSLFFANLRRIYLGKNLIQEFSFPFFHGAREIRSIDISDLPYLRSIDEDFGAAWKKVQEVRAERNPKLEAFPFDNFENKTKFYFKGTPVEIPEQTIHEIHR